MLALAAVQDGDPERTIMLWAAGSERCAETGYAVGPELTVYVDDLLDPLRERGDFERRWQHGRSLSADEALELGMRQRTAKVSD